MSLILATIRSRNKISFTFVSSGIVTKLLDSGQIAHSALKFTLNLQTIETSTCNIINNFGMDKDLQTCKIIIDDKYTMTHTKILETLDRTLKYLKGNGQFFDGELILMTGEFRKTTSFTTFNIP